LILIVGVALEEDSTTPTVTSMTYGGAPMSFVVRREQTSGAPDKNVELWYLIAPSTGANDVVINVSPNADIQAGAISLTGAKQSGQPDAFNSNLGNCWVIDVQTGEGGANTAGAGQTERWSQTVGGFESSGSYEGPKTPAGTVTMSWGVTSTDWVIAAVSIAPDTGGGGSGVAPVTGFMTTNTGFWGM
jgi:hypothetical protein